MAWTFCTSGQAIAKAGANANSDIIASGSTLLAWSNEAEGAILTETRFDFLGNYANLQDHVKNTLQETTAAYIAEQIISYDLDSYGNRTAETMLDFLHQQLIRNLKNLKDSKSQTLRSS